MKIAIIAGLLLMTGGASAAPTPSPRAELKESIEQLQKTPDDAALREKIIELARKIKPAPAVPEESRRHLVMGMTIQKKAKRPEEYAAAIAEYDAALLLAPWWGDAYYDLSVAEEAAERFDAAASALKLFLATKPAAADARKARDHLYELEAQKKLHGMREEAEERKAAAAVIESNKKFVAAIEGRWTDRNGSTIDIHNQPDGNMDISFWLSGTGRHGPYPGREIRASQGRLQFEFTADYEWVFHYDMTLDGEGRLVGTYGIMTPSGPVTSQGKPLRETDIFNR